MAKDYQQIDDKIQRWLERQKMFFVATAPLAGDGHINCSPKGMDSFCVLGPHQVAYADVGGSGIETVAHIKENQRIVMMFCAFDGPPKVFRLYGRGRAVEPHEKDFSSLAAKFPDLPVIRNLVVVDVDRIRDSCGYGVPQYEYVAERPSMKNWLADKSDDDLKNYRIDRNEHSLDGLPGLDIVAMKNSD